MIISSGEIKESVEKEKLESLGKVLDKYNIKDIEKYIRLKKLKKLNNYE